jgi:AAA+ superfamily predicted ATPase
MIDSLKKQTSTSVVKFLQRQGQAARIHSKHFKGIPPLFQDNEVYVYCGDNEIMLVIVDALAFPDGELADEQPFEGEKPLYFTESTNRVSPVWQLAVTLELIRRRLRRLSNHIPQMRGVLLTGSRIINYDDMVDEWDKMDINVFDQMENLEKLSLKVSGTDDPDTDFSVSFIHKADYDDWEIRDVEEKLEKYLEQQKPEEPCLFNFDDFDLDDEDYDTNDGVAQEGSLPFPRQTGEVPALTMNRYKNDTKTNDMLTDISFVKVNLSPRTGDVTGLYSDGQVTVSLVAKAGQFLEPDLFKCYIYAPDFFPMCDSEGEGADTLLSKNNSLDFTMPCGLVWLPGKYILLVCYTMDDTVVNVARYEMTLTSRLTFKVGKQQKCPPCGLEDTLATYIEGSIKNWSQFASTPGLAQIRQFVIKARQIQYYNEFRRMMNGGLIGISQNLLICTRNRDIDESVLMRFRDVVGYSTMFYYVDCTKLYDPSHPNPYDSLSENLDGIRERIICLANIGTLLCAGGKVIVRKVLELMMEKSRDNSLWICGTRQEIDTLLSQYPSLGSFFLKGNRLEQEPYSAFELVQVFASLLDEESLECSPEAKDALARAILQGHEKGALGAWSLDDIRRFICEEVRPRYLEHGLSNINTDQLPLLSVEDLCLDKLTSGASTFEESMRQLNAMIGLDEVKQGIRTMANNARLYLERRRRGLKTSDNMVFHCIFTGNPGTGKTTVARMLGRIYHALGLLSKGDVIVADRTRLVGQYIGQTEDNMKVVLEEARGNVLFIDEAYTLNSGSDDQKDFGHRVIESLLTVLSQPDPDMLVVFAGYTTEIDALLSSNPGLSGRFPYRYLFKDYSEEELMLIAHRLFEREEYILTDEAVTAMRDAISQTVKQKLVNFGNARWIEQFVKNGIIPAMADRLFSTGCDDFQRIEASDIQKAYEKFCPKAIELKPNHRKVVGFNA